MQKYDYEKVRSLHPELTVKDLDGNNGIGRYIFLCGSAKRSRQIAERFEDVVTKEHTREHNLLLGSIQGYSGKIDVASICTGMGCPSVDSILHQLFSNGAKRFLRIGTAGSLQPDYVKTGNVVIPTGAVRDEHTSLNYIGLEYPSIASFEMITAALQAVRKLQLQDCVYKGIVHTKDSFFAREVGCSFLKENSDFMHDLKEAGVIATEMESSHIFVLSSIFNYIATEAFKNPKNNVLFGSILGIVNDYDPIIADSTATKLAIDRAIDIGFETIKMLFKIDNELI
jgi:uridine phosphorylase